jgi:hypothetical protein
MSQSRSAPRMASERDGRGFGCSAIHRSIPRNRSSGNRIAVTGSRPVGGRPRFFFGITVFLDFGIYW